MGFLVLTIDERSNIEAGSWLSKLSLPLRQTILARATVRRLADGITLSARSSPAEEWVGVAKGAVRVSSVEPTRLVVLSKDKLLAVAER